MVLIVFLVLRGLSTVTPPPATTLQFWGVYDSPSYYSGIISQYQKEHPNIKIVYKSFSYDEYEKALINAFATQTGPDIWLMHNTWLPKHGDLISPLPQTTLSGESGPLMTLQSFQQQFVDVTQTDLVFQGQIYGLPLYVDTLALFYNKDIFNSAGIPDLPATWDEFSQDVERLTQIDSKNHITRAGATIGTAKNINRSTDILMLLMLQSGVRMTDKDNTYATFSQHLQNQGVGETALQYYTDFSNPNKSVYTWNDQQANSIDAFTQDKAAMMINYSHQIQNIHALAPRFNFGVAPVPQISGASVNVNFANYWAATVAKQSKYADEAWKFLVYLTNTDNATKYLAASDRPTARRDLIQSQQADLTLNVFATQALSARSWYQIDNSAIETIFADMIDDVNYGRMSVRDALQTAEGKVSVLMRK